MSKPQIPQSSIKKAGKISAAPKKFYSGYTLQTEVFYKTTGIQYESNFQKA